MYATKAGPRSLFRYYASSKFASDFASPALGDVVAINVAGGGGSFAPGDAGKLTRASAAPSGMPDVLGVVVQVTAGGGGSVAGIVVALATEAIPLRLLGTLSAINAFGAVRTLYLSADTPGKVTGIAPSPGTYKRAVAKLPVLASQIVSADLEPDGTNETYVTIIEEIPVAL